MDQQAIDNEVLNRIIAARRTVRSFTGEIPPKPMIEQIIEAGRQAPFAGLPNIGTTDFRHFFVFPQTSEKIAEFKKLIVENAKEKLVIYEKENNPKMQAMLNAMRATVQNGPRLGTSPWFIIVAERRGFPAREDQAIAHCMQNMWLKVTALGLGFQLVSAIHDLGDSKQLSDLLELPAKEYSYDGCMIGYPSVPKQPTVREAPHLSIKWFD